MDDQKKQLLEKLRSSTNILVTVRNNPTVDQLSACIGLTLMLNKMGKHASAVYSGETPSTIEFLQPENTLEKNTNSLRDFIIALDKSKADKLRYKVEDKVVRIFITPYKTSISQEDLDFSQGDFNVDCVVALGAHEPGELDAAITEHGRILHDAVVMSINNANEGNLGSINWQDNSASSLCELVLELSKSLNDKGKNLLDKQIATALLTGIVAETDRFSNDKTSAETMNASADLMEAGANQQLVATKLEEAMEIPATVEHDNQSSDSNKNGENEQKKPDDGTLEIDHDTRQDNQAEQDQQADQPPDNGGEQPKPDNAVAPLPMPTPDDVVAPDPNRPKEEEKLPEIKPLHPHESMLPPVKDTPSAEVGDITGVNFMAEQPSGSPNAANLSDDGFNPAVDPLSKPHTPALDHAMLNHNGPAATRDHAAPPAGQPAKQEPPQPPEAPNPTFTPYAPPQHDEPKPQDQPPAAPKPAEPPHPSMYSSDQTLTDLEKSVHSSHAGQIPSPAGQTDVDAARSEVLKALQDSPQPPEPIAALGAQPLGNDLHPQPAPQDISIDQNGNIRIPGTPLPPQPVAAPSPVSPTGQPAPAPLNPIGKETAPMPQSPADRPMDMPLPPSLNVPQPQAAPPTNGAGKPGTPPPPVPPPMMPPYPQR
ncbi:MAG TPA: hypothetical protein VFL85_04485 [Candidatus Saccharimonadales bacterium]|nr:hypothetical protein [Candidatus Saccharimonadales bacterium]